MGFTNKDLKSRFANCKQSFRNDVNSNQTEQSKHVWQLKKVKSKLYDQMENPR